jgi:hypothetical protein
MKIKKDFDSAAIITLASGVAAPPAADGIHLGAADGTVRIYIRDETTAAMTADQWSRRGMGIWDFELVNPDGEVFRELEGQVRFSREVTTA